MPVQQPKEVRQNRFKETFEQADKEFTEKYKLDIETLKRASREAVIQADLETKVEREKVMKPLFDINDLFRKDE